MFPLNLGSILFLAFIQWNKIVVFNYFSSNNIVVTWKLVFWFFLLTQNAESKVYCNNDNVSVAGQDWAVVWIAGSPFKRFAVDEKQHRIWGFETTIAWKRKFKIVFKNTLELHTKLSNKFFKRLFI